MKTIKVKSIFLFVCIVLFCILPAFSSCAEGKEDNFYADPITQDRVYETLIRSIDLGKVSELQKLSYYGIHYRIVKESITPVYTISVRDYAETGTINIERLTSWDDSLYYYIKLVNEKGEYIGSIRISDSVPSGFSSFEQSPIIKELASDGRYKASFSYADHAERIKTLLGSDDIIPVENVKLVHIDRIGEYFFIDFAGETKVIPVGYTDTYEPFEDTDLVLSMADLEQHFDEHIARYEQLIEERGLENENDFEKKSVLNETARMKTCNISSVNNIINIYDYLGIDRNEYFVPIRYAVISAAVLFVIVAVGVVFVVVCHKIKKKTMHGKA